MFKNAEFWIKEYEGRFEMRSHLRSYQDTAKKHRRTLKTETSVSKPQLFRGADNWGLHSGQFDRAHRVGTEFSKDTKPEDQPAFYFYFEVEESAQPAE